MKMSVHAALISLVLIIAAGCGEKTPNRDYIPILKERVYLLLQAVKNRDAIALDSLLTDDLKDSPSGMDSLVKFVTEPNGTFPFARFGECEIYYDDRKARADCYITDSLGKGERRITLTYENRKDRWLLKSFEPGPPPDTSK